MAHMSATPTTYAEAVKALNGRKSRTLGNNTVIRQPLYNGAIDIELHGNVIVSFFSSGLVIYSNAGYPTVTTRQRLNTFAQPGMRFAQHKGEQVYTLDNWKTEHAFNGSITFDPDEV